MKELKKMNRLNKNESDVCSFDYLFPAVSYIPEKAVVRPGENVTVYCVFNDHNINASTAMWILNFEQRLDHSQYHPVNQWVSTNYFYCVQRQLHMVFLCIFREVQSV